MTWPGAMIQKAGEGMPNYDDNTRRGNLYITIDVDFPRVTFSAEDKEGIIPYKNLRDKNLHKLRKSNFS